MPWRWAFRRPVWIEHLPPLVPVWVYVVAALAGAAAFVATASAAGAASGAAVPNTERRRRRHVAAVLVLMIIATHAAFSGVQLAEVRYRTHLVTRLLTSLLLALAAEAWTSLLWDDPSVGGRTVVALPGWGSDCRPVAAGLSCIGGPGPAVHAWDRLVVLAFDAASSRYRLVEDMPEAAGAYRPRALIRPAPPPERERALLAGPRLLGRLLPGAGAPDAMLAP
jgi:hypothetical protein